MEAKHSSNKSVEQQKEPNTKAQQSKSFFHNIKKQLTNIRNDVSKLVNTDNNKVGGISEKKPVNLQNYKTNEKPIKAKESIIDIDCNDTVPVTPNKNNLVEDFRKMEIKIQKLQNKLNEQSNAVKALSYQLEVKDQIIRNSQKSQNLKTEELLKQNLSLKKDIGCIQQQMGKNKTYFEERLESVSIENNFLREALVKQAEKTIEAKKQAEREKAKNLKEVKGQNVKQNNRVRELQQQLQLASAFELKLQQQISTLNEKIKQLQKELEVQAKNSEREISQLKLYINNFQNEKSKTIESIKTQYQKKSSLQQSMSYRQLGQSFQIKINDLVDENYRLKNRIVSLESKLQELQIQNSSYEQTIKAYQQRDQQGQSSNTLYEQISLLRQKIEELQDERDKMIDKHELQIMKLENKNDQIKNISQGLNQPAHKIIKDQINQMQILRLKIKQKTEQINRLNISNKKYIEQIVQLKKNK